MLISAMGVIFGYVYWRWRQMDKQLRQGSVGSKNFRRRRAALESAFARP